MTNLAENTVTDQEKKVIKGFYELFCQYLQEQELEPGAITLEFTFFLETFYPHDPKCHQVILDKLGPALRTLNLNVQIPANSTSSKETIFRNILHSYTEGLNTHLQLYDDDDDRLAEVTNEAIEVLINTAHNRSAAKQNLERYI